MTYLLCGCDATFKAGHIQVFDELNFYIDDRTNVTIPIDINKKKKVMGVVSRVLRLLESKQEVEDGVVILTWGGPELRLFREVSKNILINRDYDIFIIDLQNITATDHLPRGLSAAYNQQFLISSNSKDFTKDMIDARNIKQIGRLVASQFDTTIFSPHLNLSINKRLGRVGDKMYKDLTTENYQEESIMKVAQRAQEMYPGTLECFKEWAEKNELTLPDDMTDYDLWSAELSPVIIRDIEEQLQLAGLNVSKSNYPSTMTTEKFLNNLTKAEPYEVLVLSKFVATNLDKYKESLALKFAAFKLMSNLKFLKYNEYSADNKPAIMSNFKMPRKRVTYKDVGHQEINTLRRYIGSSLQTNLNQLAEKEATLRGIALGLRPEAFKKFIHNNPSYLLDEGKQAPIVNLTNEHLQALVNLIRCKVPMPNNPTLSDNTDSLIRIIESSNHESISLLMEHYTQVFTATAEEDSSLYSSPLYVLYLTVLEVCNALNIQLEEIEQ